MGAVADPSSKNDMMWHHEDACKSLVNERQHAKQTQLLQPCCPAHHIRQILSPQRSIDATDEIRTVHQLPLPILLSISSKSSRPSDRCQCKSQILRMARYCRLHAGTLIKPPPPPPPPGDYRTTLAPWLRMTVAPLGLCSPQRVQTATAACFFVLTP